jgi:tRNA threonylcarbamoyl adenosine modification protein YjeE
MLPLHVPLPTRRSTTRLARALAQAVEPGALVVLCGELGVGKTFLTRALLRALDLPQGERVTSPTFSLVHDYSAKHDVLHADLYRLGDASELGPLGLVEGRRRGAVLLVEWGLPYADDLGGDALVVTLALERTEGDLRRVASIEATGPGSLRALTALRGAVRAGARA